MCLWIVLFGAVSARCMVRSKLMGAQNLTLQEGLKDKISVVCVCLCVYTLAGDFVLVCDSGDITFLPWVLLGLNFKACTFEPHPRSSFPVLFLMRFPPPVG